MMNTNKNLEQFFAVVAAYKHTYANIIRCHDLIEHFQKCIDVMFLTSCNSTPSCNELNFSCSLL